MMAGLHKGLSSKSTAILEIIARGYRYEQVLNSDPELSYIDIFDAAREALEILGQAGNLSTTPFAHVRVKHPRAYKNWEPAEDTRLAQLVQCGRSVEEAAALLQRQPSAIRSRIEKLGLHARDASAEHRPHHVMEFYGRGRASWDGTDAQEYINRLRSEWAHRP
jgi:hypothetical protein